MLLILLQIDKNVGMESKHLIRKMIHYYNNDKHYKRIMSSDNIMIKI